MERERLELMTGKRRDVSYLLCRVSPVVLTVKLSKLNKFNSNKSLEEYIKEIKDNFTPEEKVYTVSVDMIQQRNAMVRKAMGH